MAGKLRVTLVKSPISHTQRTRATLRALGLHRLGESVEVPDNPQIRGMAHAVRFLVLSEELSAGADEGRRTGEAKDAQKEESRA